MRLETTIKVGLVLLAAAGAWFSLRAEVASIQTHGSAAFRSWAGRAEARQIRIEKMVQRIGDRLDISFQDIPSVEVTQ